MRVSEVAGQLNIAEQSVRRLVSQGRLQGAKDVKGQIDIAPESVVQYEEERAAKLAVPTRYDLLEQRVTALEEAQRAADERRAEALDERHAGVMEAAQDAHEPEVEPEEEPEAEETVTAQGIVGHILAVISQPQRWCKGNEALAQTEPDVWAAVPVDHPDAYAFSLTGSLQGLALSGVPDETIEAAHALIEAAIGRYYAFHYPQFPTPGLADFNDATSLSALQLVLRDAAGMPLQTPEEGEVE